MRTPSHTPGLKGFRYPREIIAYAVWVYHRFALSTVDVEDLLAERGVITIRGKKHWLWRAIEVSHRPTRKREKMFGRFKFHRQAERFLSAHDQINLIFRPRRYRLNTISYRHARNDAFSLWDDYAAEMSA